MDNVEWAPYVEALRVGDRSLAQVVQQLCQDNNLAQSSASAQTTAQVATLVLQALAKTPFGKNDRKENEDADTACTRHQERSGIVSRAVQAAISQKLLHDDNPVTNLFNWDAFEKRLDNLRAAFPEPEFNHSLAVKANPTRGSLRAARTAGFGAECASIAEAKHSLSLGFEPRKVVFDSPCKTLSELREMIVAGVYVNLDNEEEIRKANIIFAELGGFKDVMEQHNAQIGLRINPVVGGGSIASTSTATATSKFGLPLTAETKSRLLDIYKQNAWLQGVHVHVGSQGCPLDLLVAGTAKAVAFALEINAYVGSQQVRVLDIGGGMPTIYDGGDKEAYGFEEYADAVRRHVPELFTSGFSSIITEFGRSVFVKPGITVSKVEAVKDWAGQHIAVVHVGADQFVRTAYLPEQWSHCITVLDQHGHPKKSPSSDYVQQDIAGPLCFSGDFLAKGVLLPPIEVGDFVVIHDTGGYTLSMYSKYNSRQMPSHFAYQTSPSDVKFALLKERETTEETLACWGVDRDVKF